MSIIEIIKAVDGGVAVAVMLIALWRAENLFNRIYDTQSELIDKLTNGSRDNEPH